jgi:hypothetical protein
LAFVLYGVLPAVCADGSELESGEDGLVEVDRTPLDAVSLAPDFDIAMFRQVEVEECTVEFRENWLRDQNRMRAPSQLVKVSDMERIARQVADICHQVFVMRLEGIVAAEDATAGETRVLTVRPEVVELDILAPDINASGRQSQLATSAVRMGLRLELEDAETGATVGLFVDNRRADETGHARPTSSVGNMADTERILRYWAAEVRAQLEKTAN